MSQPGQKQLGPRIAVWIVCGLCLTAVVWIWQNFGRDSGQPMATLQPPRSKVHALGRLEPAGTVLQLAAESGNEGAVVAELFIREGDDVDAGAVLAVLDNHVRRKAALAEAQAKLESAEARLQQTKAGAKAGDIEAQQAAVHLADEQAKVAKRDLERAQELHQKKAMDDERLDLKKWEYERMLLEHRRTSGLLESIREIRATDVLVAEKEIATARATVARAAADLKSSELRATAAGRILKIHTHPGERIGDRGVIEMGDVQHMQAVAEVFEADIALLDIGMPAEVLVDGSGDRIQGTVREIGNLVARKIVLTNDPVSDTDARVVEVRIQLDAAQLHKVARLSNARIEVFIDLARQDMESSQVTDRGPR